VRSHCGSALKQRIDRLVSHTRSTYLDSAGSAAIALRLVLAMATGSRILVRIERRGHRTDTKQIKNSLTFWNRCQPIFIAPIFEMRRMEQQSLAWFPLLPRAAIGLSIASNANALKFSPELNGPDVLEPCDWTLDSKFVRLRPSTFLRLRSFLYFPSSR
jgi:hypothetical protein